MRSWKSKIHENEICVFIGYSEIVKSLLTSRTLYQKWTKNIITYMTTKMRLPEPVSKFLWLNSKHNVEIAKIYSHEFLKKFREINQNFQKCTAPQVITLRLLCMKNFKVRANFSYYHTVPEFLTILVLVMAIGCFLLQENHQMGKLLSTMTT